MRDLRMLFRKTGIVMLMIVLAFACCGCGGGESSEPVGKQQDVEEEAAAATAPQPADDAAVYSAYMDVLTDWEDEIRSYYWQQDSNNEFVDDYDFGDGGIILPEENTNKCIAVVDINDDGVDELLFMAAENESIANLHIYTYDADRQQAVEMDYDYTTRSRGEQGYLSDVAVAGGSKYMVFLGSEPGTLYMAYIITDESAYSDMTQFTCSSDGGIVRNWTVSNNYSYYDKSDEYYLNDEEVSEDEGSKYFTRAKNDYGRLIMFSGFTDIMSVFEHVKTDSPAAMCYDDAMDWLSDRAY